MKASTMVNIHNTSTFERSIMSELICHQFSRMNDPSAFSFDIGLRDPIKSLVSGSMFDVLVADFGHGVAFSIARCSRFSEFGVCAKEDVVFVDDDSAVVAGQVWAHLLIGGVPTSIISLWTLVADNGFYRDWAYADNPVYVATDSIIDTAIWTRQTATIVRTVVPPSISLRR